MLFAFNARFAKQGGCGELFFAKVHVTYHILEHMNTLRVQMAEAAVP